MAINLPTGFAQITHFFTGGPIPRGAAVVYGVENVADASPAVVAGACHDAFADEMMPRVSSSVSIVATEAKFGPMSTGPTGEVAGVQAGSSDAAVMAGQVSVLFSKSTLDGGRAGRGRMFVPGVPEAGVGNDSLLTTAFHALWVTAATDFFLLLGTSDVPMVLLHDSSAPITAPSTVQTFIPQRLVATQRRRIRR